MENIYGVDIFVVAVIFLSAIFSLYRGFVSEMLGIGSWIVAAVVGLYAMPYLDSFVMGYVSKPLLANIISFTVAAILTLVLLTLLCSKITIKVRKSVLNRLDHFLGFIFGFVRGVLILVLIYFLMMTVAPKSLEQMQKKSQTFPYLERVTQSVKEHLPESLFDNPVREKDEEVKPDNLEELIEKINGKVIKKKAKIAKKKTKAVVAKPKGLIEMTDEPEEQITEKPKDPEQEKGLFEMLNEPEVKEKKDDKRDGYDKKEREELDKLFLESIEEVDSLID